MAERLSKMKIRIRKSEKYNVNKNKILMFRLIISQLAQKINSLFFFRQRTFIDDEQGDLRCADGSEGMEKELLHLFSEAAREFVLTAKHRHFVL